MQPALAEHYPWKSRAQDDVTPVFEIAKTAVETQDDFDTEPEVDETAARVELLTTVEPFSLLDERWLEAISGLMVEETYKDTENIYTAGDISGAAYIVSQGEVAVFSDTVGEPVQLFARAKPGEIFGEVGVLDHCRRVTSARASKDTKVLRLEGCDLQRLGRVNPKFGLELAQRTLLRYMRESSKVRQLGKRSDIRIRTKNDVLLIAGDCEPLEVELRNLSIGGCCIRKVPTSWYLGESMTISLRLHDDSELLRTRGRIAWRKGESAGIAFTGISSSHGQQIDEALRRLLEPTSDAPRDFNGLTDEDVVAWEASLMTSSAC